MNFQAEGSTKKGKQCVLVKRRNMKQHKNLLKFPNVLLNNNNIEYRNTLHMVDKNINSTVNLQ